MSLKILLEHSADQNLSKNRTKSEGKDIAPRYFMASMSMGQFGLFSLSTQAGDLSICLAPILK